MPSRSSSLDKKQKFLRLLFGPGLALAYISRHPGLFLLQVIKGFRANQGLLLSGAVAYYTLLSVVPLFTVLLLVLSHFFDAAELLGVVQRYLSLAIPGEAPLIVEQARNLLAHRDSASGILILVLLFFASMAFSILENAMAIIFYHRVALRRRRFWVSSLLPYLFILLLGLGLVVITIISTLLQSLDTRALRLFGHGLPLAELSPPLIYSIGLGGEIILLTAIYLVMPVGRLRVSHALLGGIAAGLAWELTRHVLVWYFATLSLVKVVYGALATTIVALLTFEIAAVILLLGAQIIAEYERLDKQQGDKQRAVLPSPPMHTD